MPKIIEIPTVTAAEFSRLAKLHHLQPHILEACRLVMCDGLSFSEAGKKLDVTQTTFQHTFERLLATHSEIKRKKLDMGALAKAKRALIRERQREGLACAKQRRGYWGPKEALSPEQVADLWQRAHDGEQKTKLAREYGISRPTLYRYLRIAASIAVSVNRYPTMTAAEFTRLAKLYRPIDGTKVADASGTARGNKLPRSGKGNRR